MKIPFHSATAPRRLLTWLLLAFTLTLGVARADGPDDDYLAISGMIDEAGALADSGHIPEAHNKYLEAQRELLEFQRANPLWTPRTVAYRLSQVKAKVEATSATAVAQAAAPAAPTAPAATGHPVAKPSTASAVRVLSAGSEPRVALKFHPAVGDKQDVTMTMKMSMAMNMNGKAAPAMNIPGMVMTMDMEIKDIAANGDITYALTIKDATVENDPAAVPAMAAVMKTALAKFAGLVGTGRMTDHGIVQSVELNGADLSDPQMAKTLSQIKDSMSSSSFVLPAEPVGAGARWEYKSRVKSQGMTLDQTVGYELVSVDGDHLNVATTLAQNAASQKIANPAMPALKMDLTKMSGTGTGKSVVDLGRMFPLNATLEEELEMNMAMKIGQQNQNMETKMSMNLSFESK